MAGRLLVQAGAELLAGGVLLGMLVQDWRWRGIQWPLFPLLAGLLLLGRIVSTSVPVVLSDWGLNLVLLGLQLLLLMLYVRLRLNGQLLQYLGLGDILFWAASALQFSPGVFLLYHVLSLSLALTGYLLARHLTRRPLPARIPLAGLQAAVLGLVLLITRVYPAGWPVSDAVLFSWLSA